MGKTALSKDEQLLIEQIAVRAFPYDSRDCLDFIEVATAVHCNGCPLDLERWLKFDDFNFDHDVYGILDNIDRNTGELKNFFSPRCEK